MLDSVMCFQRFIILEHLTADFTRNLSSSHMNTFNMCFHMSSYFEAFPAQLTTIDLDTSFIISSSHVGVIIKRTTSSGLIHLTGPHIVLIPHDPSPLVLSVVIIPLLSITLLHVG